MQFETLAIDRATALRNAASQMHQQRQSPNQHTQVTDQNMRNCLSFRRTPPAAAIRLPRLIAERGQSAGQLPIQKVKARADSVSSVK